MPVNSKNTEKRVFVMLYSSYGNWMI